MKYDDLPSDAALAQLNPVRVPYNGLQFGQFDARADGASQLRSISPSNTIASTVAQQLTSGSPANITSKYTGSKVVKFDLKSTYGGCAVLTAASAGLEQACDLQFNGTTTAGKTVSKTFPFTGTALDPKPLAFFDFKGAFDGVTTVTVQVANSQTLPATTVLYLDDTQVKEYISS